MEEVDREHSRGSGAKRMQCVTSHRKSGRIGPRGKYSSSPIVEPLEERWRRKKKIITVITVVVTSAEYINTFHCDRDN